MPPKKRASKGKKGTTAAAASPAVEPVAAPAAASPAIGNKPATTSSRSKWSDVYSNDLVLQTYQDNIMENIQKLDASGYLEDYLWKHVTSQSSFEHTYSIIVMLNAKFLEGIDILGHLSIPPGQFEGFFESLVKLTLSVDQTWTYEQRCSLMVCLINIFKSMEYEGVRRTILKYLSLPLWDSLSPPRLVAEFEDHPHLERHWAHYLQEKKASLSASAVDDKEEEEQEDDNANGKKRKGRKSTSKAKTPQKKAKASREADVSSSKTSFFDNAPSVWLPSMLKEFLGTVEGDGGCVLDTNNRYAVLYTERFLEFLIDLMSQLPTRRFLSAVIDDLHLMVRVRRSKAYATTDESTQLFRQLTDLLNDCIHFEIEDQTGKALSPQEVTGIVNQRLHSLQRIAYTSYRDELQDLVFSSTGELGKEANLRKHFALLSSEQLLDVAQKLGYVYVSADSSPPAFDFVVDVLVYRLSYRKSQLDALSQTSLYPTETLLWDPNSVPLGNMYNGAQALALPKLNLQFLTAHDYLLRNFTLFRLESAYEIRQDLSDAIKRIAPRQSLSGVVSFGGWARMALPISSFGVDEVTKPNLGEVVPGKVTCSVEIDVSKFQGEIRQEWESLREHDG